MVTPRTSVVEHSVGASEAAKSLSIHPRTLTHMARRGDIPAHPLAENDEDVKTVQSLMRHANSNITMNIYTHAVSSKKRRALSKVVEMILREEKTTPVA